MISEFKFTCLFSFNIFVVMEGAAYVGYKNSNKHETFIRVFKH